MTRITWPLNRGRPAVEVELAAQGTSHRYTRRLLADTGGGTNAAPFALLLDEQDCLNCSESAGHLIELSGSYSGEFRIYIVKVNLPQLNFSARTPVVGIEHPPKGFDGIAAFRFLNRFSYGNFGRSEQFGLEPPDASRLRNP